MKKTIALFLFYCITTLVTYGQIRNTQVNNEDIMWLLEDKGLKFFKYDLSDQFDETYNINIYIKEVDSNGPKEKLLLSFGKNKKSITEFNDKDKEEYRLRNPNIKDEEIYHHLLDELKIGFNNINDSLVDVKFNISGNERHININLRNCFINPNRKFFYYEIRTFKEQDFEPNKEIPLLMYGSAWYDKQSGLVRFCMGHELDSDLSNDAFQYMPHYYVIGIIFDKI